MKYFIIGHILDTKDYNLNGIQAKIQSLLDTWLGNETTRIEVNELGPKKMQFTIYRQYGPFYRDPFMHPGKHEIFSFDKQILLGLDWQENTHADFSKNPNPYNIYYDVEDFEREYKKICRKNHASRVKAIEYQEALDHITFTVEGYEYKKK